MYVKEIEPQDRFVCEGTHYWTAAKAAEVTPEQTTLTVQFPDGGFAVRVFEPEAQLDIERDGVLHPVVEENA